MKDYILELDKPRELRFGFKANRMIRQKFGDRSLDDLMNALKVDEMPILVWAGLKWEDNSLTVERVEDMLDEVIPKKYTILDVSALALEALAMHLGVDSKTLENLTKRLGAETKKVPAGDQVAEAEKPKAATVEKKQPTKTTPSTKKRKK